MNIEEGIVTFLNAQGALAAVQNAIAPWPLPQLPQLPRITYHRVDSVHYSSHSGSSGLDHARFQFDVWAGSYSAAHTVGEALTNALDTVRGTWGTVTVYLSQILNTMDIFDPVTGYYRYVVDAKIWWKSL